MDDWCMTCQNGKIEAYKNIQTGEIKYIRACQFVKLKNWYSDDWKRHSEFDRDCFGE